MSSYLSRLNPRNHIAAAIGWTVTVVALLAALAVGLIVMLSARAALERDDGALFAAEAAQIAALIDSRLAERFQDIEATAAVLGAVQRDLPQAYWQSLTRDARRALPGFEWLGVAAQTGLVVSGSDTAFTGTDVAARDWFRQGLKAPYIGVETGPAGNAPRTVWIAAPLKDVAGKTDAVVAGRLGTAWLDRLEQSTRRAISLTHAVGTAIITEQGDVLAGGSVSGALGKPELIENFRRSLPPAGNRGFVVDGGLLVGFARVEGSAAVGGLGWWVVLSEPTSSAFAPAFGVSARIFALVMGCGLLTAGAAAALSSVLMRRLGRIARNADDLRLGRATSFAVPGGRDEVARIGASLAALFRGLQASNTELSELNRELDRRVEERTREVQRLFEENKNAAVTRERFRMSRDLHDTLAHSMLAVLTQIRMTRKVVKSNPASLGSELAEAERVAQEGLDLARSAVNQLRYVAVRDDGLGPALARLVRRLQERAVLDVHLDVDPSLQGMTNQVAETVFRIAEEALRNVEKHADAGAVSIEVRLIPASPGGGERIGLTIRDDGAGFDPALRRPGHFGLIGLREQAQLIGGAVEVASAPGEGTTVRLEVPL